MFTRFQSYITALSVLLLILLGLATAKVIWQAYTHWWLAPTYHLETVYIDPTLVPPPIMDLAATIGKGYLFDRQHKQKPIHNIREETPYSAINVQIRGILTMPNGAQSMAILSLDGAADKVFGIGSELKPGHQIDNIITDGIVVNHNGRLQTIRLPRNSFPTNTTKIGYAASGLSDLRAEVLRNPLVLKQYINFASYTQDNQFTGYRVNVGNHPEIFLQLGLRANDVLVSVDGIKISELAGRMDILNNLAQAKSLRLGIIRNGQEQQLLVNFI